MTYQQAPNQPIGTHNYNERSAHIKEGNVQEYKMITQNRKDPNTTIQTPNGKPKRTTLATIHNVTNDTTRGPQTL